LRKFIVLFAVMFLFALSSCSGKESGTETPEPEECLCETTSWVFPEGTKCLQTAIAELKCTECGKVLETKEQKKQHNKVTEEVEATCVEDGYYRDYCTDCTYDYKIEYPATGEHELRYEIISKATDKRYGLKQRKCATCDFGGDLIKYVNNGYSDHGKLSVVGPDLVDENGEKFQLIGISTHGLQWFGQYVNFTTIDALHNEFGINVLRLSLYTSEGGYCESEGTRKENLYQTVCEGIRIATELDMYVIVDWHMVGAEDPNDKNPLYYKDEAIEFFGRITAEFKDYNNILYEIMNEPCGETTWEHCRTYANQVIPVIRQNTDAIVLVGNPHWSANLNAVMQKPLTGYENIMYTYHFYAADHSQTYQVQNAYDKGFPVFISEHGGMNSAGDGEMNISHLENWYRILDARNISYVAWNLSNSKGSASILKHGTPEMDNFSDEVLKEWGVWYKAWVRKKFNFPGQR
jgi:aryl-phospho-beta-D-glucosidase BglC (GH1 family)